MLHTKHHQAHVLVYFLYLVPTYNVRTITTNCKVLPPFFDASRGGSGDETHLLYLGFPGRASPVGGKEREVEWLWDTILAWLHTIDIPAKREKKRTSCA